MPYLPRRALAATLVLSLLAACGGMAPSTAPPSERASQAPSGGSMPPSALQAARGELDRALDRLESIHPEPFHAVDRATFVAALNDLKPRLPELTADEAAVALMRAWAMLATERDGHQFALPLDEETDPILPIRVYEFAEGVFVTDAMAPHQDLAGARITAVGETPIDNVLARLEPLVPRDGPATVPAFRPLYLLHATVLRGLGIVGDGSVPLTVEDADGSRRVELAPVPSAEFRAWAGWLPFTGLPPRDRLRYTQPSDANLTVELLDDRVVYVRYRQIQQLSTERLEELLELARRPVVERIIVDVRQNPGGNNFTYPPLVSALSDPAIDQPGRLVLLTDRITFSAASNFSTVVEQGTGAAFVGEPMGGGLNFWNDVDWIILRDFIPPMRLAVSTRYWEKSTPDDPRLSIEPDLPLSVRAADYFAGRDPVLERAMEADLS